MKELGKTNEDLAAVNDQLLERIAQLQRENYELRRRVSGASKRPERGKLQGPIALGSAELDNGKIKWLNDLGKALLGFGAEDEYARKDFSLIYESHEEYERVSKIISEALNQGKPTAVEAVLRRKNHGVFRSLMHVSACPTSHPQTTAILTFSDISEQKEAEKSLKESQESFRTLFRETLVGIFVCKEDTFVYANDRLGAILGFNPGELLGKSLWDVVDKEDLETVRKLFREKLKGRLNAPRLFFRMICKDGGAKHVEALLSQITWEGQSAILGNLLDDTERRNAEKSLRHSEDKFRLIFEHSPVGIFHFDVNGIITACNENFVRIIGSTREALTGFDMLASLANQPILDAIRAALLGGSGNFTGPYQSVTADKTTPVKCRFTAIISEDGAVLGGMGIIEDVTEQRRYEKHLAEETERLTVTLRSIGDGVISTDIQGKITLINRVAESLTGWSQSDACGRDLSAVFHIRNEKTGAPCADLVAEVVRTGTVVGLANHTVLISKDGIQRAIADSAAPIHNLDGEVVGVVIVFRDVTEKQKIEKELVRMEKLESLGVLAGGIAHDFNNILTALLGNIALAKLKSKPGEIVHKRLTEAEKAAARARDLTLQLLTFSKGGAPVKSTASIADIVIESCSFALRGSNVSYQANIDPDLWNVEVDKGQISQVINNIIINADQAMPDGGRITVNVINAGISEDNAPGPRKGDYVRISIGDEGAGIPKEDFQRIFDPYFTTKPRGSGLGLATSYSIVTKHDGFIYVDSEPGAGATFSIYLPATPYKNVSELAEDQVIWKGAGRVLLMDDEESILEFGSEMLSVLGYQPVTASDGKVAVELYEESLRRDNRFDAVIMDLTVPGAMGGGEAIRHLLRIDPNVKAIVTSGYSNDPIMSEYWKHGFSGVVLKPYNINELGKALQQVVKSAGKA
jgi:PAS domain S-box-containing protein